MSPTSPVLATLTLLTLSLPHAALAGRQADKGMDLDAVALDWDLEDEPVEDFDVPELDDEPFEDLETLDDLAFADDLELLDDDEPAEAELEPAGYLPDPLRLDVAGKQALDDNYRASIVAVQGDAVVVELPVLLARSRAGFEGDAYWLRADVRVEGEVVASVAQWVGQASLAEFGPSFAFFEIMVPVNEDFGSLQLQVSRSGSAGDAGAPLFTQRVAYELE